MLKNFTVRCQAIFPIGVEVVDPDDHISTPGRGVLAFRITEGDVVLYVPAYLQEIIEPQGREDTIIPIYAAKFFWEVGHDEPPKFETSLGWYRRVVTDPEFAAIPANNPDQLIKKHVEPI